MFSASVTGKHVATAAVFFGFSAFVIRDRFTFHNELRELKLQEKRERVAERLDELRREELQNNDKK